MVMSLVSIRPRIDEGPFIVDARMNQKEKDITYDNTLAETTDTLQKE